jgi:hypothetical protein
MPRPLSAAREREFQELYAFVDFYSTQVIKPLANSPKMADVCVDIIEQYGRSKALEGLRMATNDILEELGRIPSAKVESLDEGFRRAGLVSCQSFGVGTRLHSNESSSAAASKTIPSTTC